MGKRILAFDLETIADPEMLKKLPPVKVNGSLKDLAKIEVDLIKKEKKQIEEMGLSPMTSLICAAGWYDGETAGCIMLKDEASEKELLEEWWSIAENYDHFVTFNGRPFDMRHIMIHGMKHGVRPSVAIDRGRGNKGNHTDLRQILAGDDKFAPGKLDFFAQAFLDDHKTEGIDGIAVQAYWDLGQHDDIATYCKQDCVLTYDLYVLADKCGLLE